MEDDLIPLHDILGKLDFLRTLRERTEFESFRTNPADIRAASCCLLVISEAVPPPSGGMAGRTARPPPDATPITPLPEQ